MVRDGPAVPEAVGIQLTAALSYKLVGGPKMGQELTFIHSFIIGDTKECFPYPASTSSVSTAGQTGEVQAWLPRHREEFREQGRGA